MSALQRALNYMRANPIAVYIGGGIILHQLRSISVSNAYNENFARFDVERQLEL